MPRLVRRRFSKALYDDRGRADFGQLDGQPRKPGRGFDFRARPKAPGLREPRADDVGGVGLNSEPLATAAVAAGFGRRANGREARGSRRARREPATAAVAIRPVLSTRNVLARAAHRIAIRP
jgi:hypothetical protein